MPNALEIGDLVRLKKSVFLQGRIVRLDPIHGIALKDNHGISWHGLNDVEKVEDRYMPDDVRLRLGAREVVT